MTGFRTPFPDSFLYTVRTDIERRGGVPVIPMRKGRKVQIAIDDFIYALRNRI